MAFADDVRNSTLNLETLASRIEACLGDFTSGSGGAVSQVADESWDDLVSVSLAVVTGDMVLLFGSAQLSLSTAAGFGMTLRLTDGSSAIGMEAKCVAHSGYSGGQEVTLVCFHIHEPSTGTQTYKLQYSGQGGAGETVYSANSRLYAVRFRNS